MPRVAKSKTRDLDESRKAILQAAFAEIYSQGFQGASVDQIVSKTPYTKGAFYHQFPTKLDLGYALVEEVIVPMIAERWIDPLKKFDNPLEGILHQMKTLIGDQKVSSLRLGCPLNNLVQEMSPLDRGFHQRLSEALNFWVDELSLELSRGQKNGFIKKEVKAKEAALFIVMAHEGFFGTIKGLQNESVFKSLFESLKIYFKEIST